MKNSLQSIPSFWGTWTFGRYNPPIMHKHGSDTQIIYFLDNLLSHWLCCGARASLYFSRLTLHSVNLDSKPGTPNFMWHFRISINGYIVLVLKIGRSLPNTFFRNGNRTLDRSLVQLVCLWFSSFRNQMPYYLFTKKGLSLKAPMQ